MKNAQSEPRPKQVNIHVLETAVLQYPADYHHIHSNSGTCQFVFSCQTGSGSIDSYGASNDFSGRTHSHQHHAHHPGHDHDLQCDYRSSDIISNLYFKTDSPSAESTGVSGTPSVRSLSPLRVSSTSRLRHKQQAASNTESQLPEGDSNANILISQLSTSSPQATDSGRTPSPKLRYVPCPYRPISDRSLDQENSPPPSRMNTETDSFGERSHLSKSEDMEQQSNRHHFDDQSKQTSSLTSKKRHSGTSSNWGMSIQTYYDQRAATNAMILAARQYMESREAEECKIVQRTDTTRIIWNDSTKQKLIWSITSTYMDNENPGDLVERDYYPSWWEQKEQQL
ncbi:hypothetical protein BGZ79_009506 [Entomortierella chlamydospora]|nr:hypothetical protein BGZ79_009506 [Entomortierella chlamydospora]